MTKKEKQILMGSTFDMSSIIARLHSKIEVGGKLDKEEGRILIENVSSWQSFVAKSLKLTQEEAIESYKFAQLYNKNADKMAKYMIGHEDGKRDIAEIMGES